jgi:Raf kinase inhibitor-like YbhB/YbcL family protein
MKDQTWMIIKTRQVCYCALEFQKELEYSTARGRIIKMRVARSVGLIMCLSILVYLAGCKSDQAAPAAEGEIEMSIEISSTAFKEGDTIPRIYTCDDQNVSPPLSWAGVPQGSLSLALIMDDPDAPSGTFDHWILFNLPPDLTGLSQDNHAVGTEGKNGFGRMGYGGPCPPRGSNHRYMIKIYALDSDLVLKSGASKVQLESAMNGHILAQGQMMVRYGR